MDKFDEYKFFAQVTHELSQRRQAATQTYLTVNTVISAALGFLVKDMSFRGLSLVLVSLPFFLVGVLACTIWHRIITQYKALAGWLALRAVDRDGKGHAPELPDVHERAG